MTLAEQGAYRNLLDELWLRHGFLPTDDRILAKISGDSSEWPKVRAAVMARFILGVRGWHHLTHDEISLQSLRRAAKQQAYRDRINGNGHGNATGNGNGNGLGNKPGSPSPSPSPSLISVSVTKEDPPLPPFKKGGKRLTKAEIAVATRVRHNSLGPCHHDPKCPSVEVCIQLIAYEIRDHKAQKAAVS